MRDKLRKILRRNYRRMLREELEVREYEYKKRITDDAFFSKEVEPLEDSWAGGQNIHHQLDHNEAQGGEPNVRGVEVLKITESRLRSIIRKAIVEAKSNELTASEKEKAKRTPPRDKLNKGDFLPKSVRDKINTKQDEADEKEEEEDLLVEPDVNPDREDQQAELEEMINLAGGAITGYIAPVGKDHRG